MNGSEQKRNILLLYIFLNCDFEKYLKKYTIKVKIIISFDADNISGIRTDNLLVPDNKNEKIIPNKGK